MEVCDFGLAMEWMRNGRRVARLGWSGDKLSLQLVTYWYSREYPNKDCTPFIAMNTADGKFVPWPASQTDILATDWRIAD